MMYVSQLKITKNTFRTKHTRYITIAEKLLFYGQQ